MYGILVELQTSLFHIYVCVSVYLYVWVLHVSIQAIYEENFKVIRMLRNKIDQNYQLNFLQR